MTWQEAQKSGDSVLAISFGGPNITKNPPAAARTKIERIILGNLGDMRWPPSILLLAELYRRQHTIRETDRAKNRDQAKTIEFQI
jgi:hypothetical protein